ncbi:MAG: GAF domain-containing protein [Proteobacteria bacterium]|nr:GAF domain-containing protein [Pseudomonadota bacterium]
MATSQQQAALVEVARALGAPGQPGPFYAALDRAMAGLIGHKLFTLMIYDAGARTVARVYSNQPDAYPVGGTKPYSASSLFDQLFERHQAVVVRNAEEIRRSFVDQELIARLGCSGSLHLPVVHDGVALGIMNLLHEAGRYDDPHIDLSAPFAAMLVTPFLIALRGRV